MEQFYEYLEKIGMTNPADVQGVLSNTSPEKMYEIALKSYELLTFSKTKDILPKDNLFNFSVSSSICGGIHPCSDVNCRLNTAYRFAIFSAMYANSITIPNFFDHIYEHKLQFKNKKQQLFFLNRIFGDFVIFLYYKPLAECGLLRLNHRARLLCKDCLRKTLAQEAKLEKSFTQVEDKLEKKLSQNLKFTFDGRDSLIIGAKQGYIGSEVFRFGILPKNLRKYKDNSPYVFTPTEVVKYQFGKLLLSPIFDDLLLQKYSLKSFGPKYSYLTDRAIESDILAILDEEYATKNQVVFEALSHNLPFLEDASVEDILNIRKNEKPYFEAYRDAFSKVIKDTVFESKKTIKEAVNDIVLPQINKIERVVDSHKRFFKNEMKKKIVYNSIAFGAAIFGDKFLGLNFSELIKYYAPFAAIDIYSDITSAHQIPSEAMNNDYYFLWKLKTSKE